MKRLALALSVVLFTSPALAQFDRYLTPVPPTLLDPPRISGPTYEAAPQDQAPRTIYDSGTRPMGTIDYGLNPSPPPGRSDGATYYGGRSRY